MYHGPHTEPGAAVATWMTTARALAAAHAGKGQRQTQRLESAIPLTLQTALTSVSWGQEKEAGQGTGPEPHTQGQLEGSQSGDTSSVAEPLVRL